MQKRQLDWNGGGKVYHYDHLAVSSDQEEQVDESIYAAPYSPSGLPGEPGIDYPILPSIPLTDFHCRGRVPGFYGDTQTACQVSASITLPAFHSSREIRVFCYYLIL